MSTTTIRLDDDLKERVVTAAERSGKTAHAFIVEAIAQTVEQTELNNALDELADRRWAQLLADGKAVSWDDAKSYLEKRAAGHAARRPAARKLKGGPER